MTAKRSQFLLKLLAIAVVGAVVAIAGLAGWNTQHMQLLNERKELAKQNAKYEKMLKELESLPAQRIELASLETRLRSLDSNLADYQYIPSYLKQLQQAAATTGNVIRSIKPTALRPLDLKSTPLLTSGPAEKDSKKPVSRPTATARAGEEETKPSYQIQQINLEVEGNYPSLLRLLDTLRGFPKMIYVRTVNIMPREEKGVVTLVARMETYAIITPDQYKKPAEEEEAGKGGSR